MTDDPNNVDLIPLATDEVAQALRLLQQQRIIFEDHLARINDDLARIKGAIKSLTGDGDASPKPRMQLKDRILAAMSEDRVYTAAEIVAAIGRHEGSVRSTLSRLVSTGELHSAGRGRYTRHIDSGFRINDAAAP